MPKICLYIVFSKEKNVELRTNFMALRNSLFGIEVFIDIKCYLLEMLLYAFSNETLVKRETTSNDARV